MTREFMNVEALDALSRLAARRFASFADAAGSVLDLLAGAAPDGCLILCQADWESGEARVLDARGGGIERGLTLPLNSAPGGSAQLIDAEALAAWWPGAFVSAPLDAADGSIVGALLGSPGDHGVAPRHLAQLLLISARLLSYEWESISTRAELRRLSEAARDRDVVDPATGLPTRAILLTAMEREWELARRGTVDSYAVVCRLPERGAIADRQGAALADLMLKDVAEALEGCVRRTDHLARGGEDELVAVLVGCKGPEGARAFLGRAERTLARAATGRAAAGLAYGIQALSEADSAVEALEAASAAAELGELVAPISMEAETA